MAPSALPNFSGLWELESEEGLEALLVALGSPSSLAFAPRPSLC
jgi:hypothetical protein